MFIKIVFPPRVTSYTAEISGSDLHYKGVEYVEDGSPGPYPCPSTSFTPIGGDSGYTIWRCDACGATYGRLTGTGPPDRCTAQVSGADYDTYMGESFRIYDYLGGYTEWVYSSSYKEWDGGSKIFDTYRGEAFTESSGWVPDLGMYDSENYYIHKENVRWWTSDWDNATVTVNSVMFSGNVTLSVSAPDGIEATLSQSEVNLAAGGSAQVGLSRHGYVRTVSLDDIIT